MVPLSYWYNSFHGIMTEKIQLLCPFYLESGIIVVALWRTRCNSPVVHVIMFDVKTALCSLSKEILSKFCVDSNKMVDSKLFDTILRYMRIACLFMLVINYYFRCYKDFIMVNRWFFDPARRLLWNHRRFYCAMTPRHWQWLVATLALPIAHQPGLLLR